MATSQTGEGYGIRPAGDSLPAETRLGPIRLQVGDLPRSVAYYEEVLGLVAKPVDARTVHLFVPNAPKHLVELSHHPGTRPVPRGGTLGLFHFAILLPNRPSLGRFLDHLIRANVRFGAADHLVSEAVYLWDPDGLGIEVYADRPSRSWRTRGVELMMATERLDVPSVIASANGQPWDGLPTGTTMGHIHLSVDDLERARRFFHLTLGFDLTVWSYAGALFMSAGGYHHHLGTNTWAADARRPNAGDAQLLEWQLLLPSAADVEAAEERLRAAGSNARDGVVHDPWGIRLRLRASTSATAASVV